MHWMEQAIGSIDPLRNHKISSFILSKKEPSPTEIASLQNKMTSLYTLAVISLLLKEMLIHVIVRLSIMWKSDRSDEIKLEDFLPSCGCVNTTAWMHHMYNNIIHGEKAGNDQQKNVTFCFEQFLEAIAHKTAAVRPLISNLTNLQSKTNKRCSTLLEKQGKTHKQRFPMNSKTWTRPCWPISEN